MSSFRFKLAGREGSIQFDAFFNALNYWYKIIEEVDVAVSGVKKGSLDWYIVGLSMGSLEVDVQGISRLENKDYSNDVIHYSIGGLRALEESGLTPPFLSSNGITNTKKLVKLVGSHGISAIELNNYSENALLTSKASANIDQITRVTRRSIGSVEGKLESISVHQGSRFVVYHHLTNKAVTCTFDPGKLLELAKKALGKRVIASGEVLYNLNGEPIRVITERLRILKEENELPSISRIGGSDPDFTGGLSTAEFLRGERGA